MSENGKLDSLNKLIHLQDTFKQELPGRMTDIESAWRGLCQQGINETNLLELHRKVHSLAGTGACFGAIDVSDEARELEHILKSMLKDPELLQALTSALQKQIEERLELLKKAADRKLFSDFSYFKHRETGSRGEGNLLYLLSTDELLTEELLSDIEQPQYQVQHFTSLSELDAACKKALPVVSILDIETVDVNEYLNDRQADSPSIICVSSQDDIQARLKVARQGVCRYFTKPIDTKKLNRTLTGLLSQQFKKPYRVLLVDDDETLLGFYATVLREAGMVVETLSDPLQCLNVLEAFKPDVIVMDVYMPGCSGTELAQVIRQDDAWLMIPILFLSVESDLSHQILAMNLGDKDFLVKPVDASHLVAAVVARAKQAYKTTQLNNKLKDALRENKYQLVTMDQHDIVSTADVKGQIISVNERFCEISGYSRDELLGQNHRLLKSGFHSDSFYREMWHSISNGKVWRGTICNLNKAGEEYWVESTIVPFLDSRGKPYKYVSARTDVTALRKSEDRLNRSQTFANIGTWDWNIKTGSLFWSDRIWPLFGYQKEITDTTYDNFIAAVHPDDKQKVIDAVTNCVEQGADYNIEHRVVWPDNSVHWVSESGDVVRNEKGEPLHMMGVVQDISARKHAELVLAENKKQLLEAQALAQIGNWQANMLTGELIWSDEIYRIFGYEPGSFAPSVEAFKVAVHPDDRVRVKESEDLAISTGYHDVVHRIVLPDGGIRYVHELAQAETDDQGNLLRMAGTVQDITVMMDAEKELIDAREEAENANRAKSQFLSSMSHELRTPMNAIIGFSQLLKLEDDQTLSQSQIENIDEIVRASDHLLKLINEVLDLAKIEAGRIDLSIETVSIGEVIGESMQFIGPLAQKRGIEISLIEDGVNINVTQLLKKQTAVRADRIRLRQVLLNLLSNAVKYNCDNGKIIIACTRVENNQTRISISDTGNGLTKEQQSQLFIAFNRLGVEQLSIEGTGIGLVITRNIVELMGGKIGVNSQPGEGSTFWFELPGDSFIADQNQNMDETSASALPAPTSEEHQYTVLYIEDNPANLRLVAQLLALRSNIHMWSAHEPLLGLELAEEHNPDLILLDINLPGMDGYEVLEHLRQHKTTYNTPVIAISANAMPRDIERGLEAGFNEYITKPLDVRKLLQAVDDILQGTNLSDDEQSYKN